MEAEKSQDHQTASWSPRRDGDVSSSLSPSSKAGKDDVPTQREAGREKECLLSVLFYSSLQQIGWGPPVQGRTTCFAQSANSCVNLIQKHPTETLQIMSDQISGHPVVYAS